MTTRRIAISNYPIDLSSRKIEEIFKKFGRIIYSDITRGSGSIVILFIKFLQKQKNHYKKF